MRDCDDLPRLRAGAPAPRRQRSALAEAALVLGVGVGALTLVLTVLGALLLPMIAGPGAALAFFGAIVLDG